MGTCLTRLSQGNITQIDYITDNEYVITSWGEKLETRCTGKNAATISLARGVHDLVLSPSCSITSSSWTLSAISLHHLHVELIDQQIPRTHSLNLSSLLHPSYIYRPESPLQPLARIEALPLDLLRAPLLKPIPWQQNTNTLQIILIVIILALLGAISAYVAWLNRSRCPPLPCCSYPQFKPIVLPTSHPRTENPSLAKFSNVSKSPTVTLTNNSALLAAEGIPEAKFREMLNAFDQVDTRRGATPSAQRKRHSRYDSDPDNTVSTVPLTGPDVPSYKDLRAQLPNE
jgi:hypothetical protein